jgi:uncharacterized protein YgbK (DUF1537 family)
MNRWLILADDLTGAADCGIVFARHGRETVVVWGDGEATGDVVAADVDSRRDPPAQAAARHVAVQAARRREDMRLYKKIDSTLRGQPAAELAAQLAALRRDGARAPLAVCAPAFPATGRVTIGGRVVVHGVPLEQTPLWAREHSYANASLPDILATAGLTCEVIALDTIRAGADAIASRLGEAGRAGIDVAVCDAVEVTDLDAVARASLTLTEAMWVGSAGLAAALAAVEAPPRAAAPVRIGEGVVLMVIGSVAEASRRQAADVIASGLVIRVAITPEVLFGGAGTAGWAEAMRSLAAAALSAKPVLVEIASAARPDLRRGAELAGRLAELIEVATPKIAALFATGGETACALLSRLGVTGIRLLDEAEPGVPLGVTLGARRVPVITKAGAFGDAHTIRRCLAKLGVCPPSIQEI